MVQPKTLTLLGRTDPEIIKQLGQLFLGEKDQLWFFVDYAEEEVPVGESFDVLLQGPEKTLIPNFAIIILKKVLDQFGNKLDAIPKGFQTVCCFQFNQIPKAVNALPVIKDWEYNPIAVSLAKHESIRLSQPDAILKIMHQVWVVEIKHELGADKSTLPEFQLIQFIRERYKVDDVDKITRLLNNWKMLGLAQVKPNNELELIA